MTMKLLDYIFLKRNYYAFQCFLNILKIIAICNDKKSLGSFKLILN